MGCRELKYGELKTQIFHGRNEMGHAAAKEAARYMRELGEGRDGINVLFAAAPSQNEFLAALAMEPDVPWDKVTAMQLDEYIGISSDAPQRFANYLETHIFSKVSLRQCIMIDCEAEDLEKEIKRYSEVLRTHPPDIAFIGIGENGHIAFNDPDQADFSEKVWMKLVELDLESRVQQVNDGCFEELSQVPKRALTVTIPPIISAGRIFCMVPGVTKAEAVRKTLRDSVDPHVPSTILRIHKNATLYLDEDSAAFL